MAHRGISALADKGTAGRELAHSNNTNNAHIIITMIVSMMVIMIKPYYSNNNKSNSNNDHDINNTNNNDNNNDNADRAQPAENQRTPPIVDCQLSDGGWHASCVGRQDCQVAYNYVW